MKFTLVIAALFATAAIAAPCGKRHEQPSNEVKTPDVVNNDGSQINHQTGEINTGDSSTGTGVGNGGLLGLGLGQVAPINVKDVHVLDGAGVLGTGSATDTKTNTIGQKSKQEQ